MKTFSILFSIVSVAVLPLAMACHHPSDAPVADTAASAQSVADSVACCSEEPDSCVAADSVAPAQPAPAPSSSARRNVNNSPRKAAVPEPKSQRIYVETYDGNGKVWGYVTMKGDSGRGEIHDANDNHYTVFCTRHGNELFATDHNSRQYVFKL